MIQLLISVKNIEEARLALQHKVDLIDLKDPANGALGALDSSTVQAIVQAIDGQATISATIGEDHLDLQALVADIVTCARLGVDIVKLPVSPLFDTADFTAQMLALRLKGIKLVAVFFADQQPKLETLAVLAAGGFYGAMLDTQSKQAALTSICSPEYLANFVRLCQRHQLLSGLAGSLRVTHMASVLKAEPSYIGFRGGVCEAFLRSTSLSQSRLNEVGDVLFKHNRLACNAAKGLDIALHT